MLVLLQLLLHLKDLPVLLDLVFVHRVQVFTVLLLLGLQVCHRTLQGLALYALLICCYLGFFQFQLVVLLQDLH